MLCPPARVVCMSIFNWGVWMLMVILIGSQFLGIVWSSSKSIVKTTYGNVPTVLGPLGGFNDEPYADRAIVCLTQGRSFVPTQLSKVLADSRLAPIVETSGISINGFRVVRRTNEMTLQPQAAAIYDNVCDRMDFTIQAIQDSCRAIGYTSITIDSLRIVNGVFSNTTHEITRALPILVLPYWDNAGSIAYVIPGSDGSACIFRLYGVYQSTTYAYGLFRATPRDVRLTKTAEYVRNPGGVWRNGWYEVPDGQRWYSTMLTSSAGGPFGLVVRQFDTLGNKEINCTRTPVLATCQNSVVVDRWGRELSKAAEILRYDQVLVTNGSRYGVFRYESTTLNAITNVYSLEAFVSNSSIFLILLRWLVSLGAMVYSWYIGTSTWQTTGIGALSSSRTFNLLPLMLLPRLKLTLTAFFTVGCNFEGSQAAFASAWYIIYPGIVEFMLYYYSLLNILTKITYRRMNDVLFGPTMLAMCALHYFRVDLAAWSVLGLNGRITTLLLSDQVDALTLLDFFSTNAAMRINGNAKPIFYIKMILVGLNLVPLLLAENMTEKRGRRLNRTPMCEIERILALRASNLGGLGQSPVYARRKNSSEPVGTDGAKPLRRTSSLDTLTSSLHGPSLAGLRGAKPAVVVPTSNDLSPTTRSSDHVLIGYEMSRIGYLVFGGQFLLSFDDWYILTSLAPFRVIEKLWNYRITVFEVVRNVDGTYRVLGRPHLCRLDNPRLRVIPFYQITVCDFE